MQNRTDTDIMGIDVSHHNGDIDWNAVKNSGVQFAYMKASEGDNFKDNKFETYVKEARAAGLPAGAYHFARPTDNAPQTEARHFLDTLKTGMPDYGDLMPVLDLEAPTEASQSNGEFISNWARSFISVIQQETGKQVLLYTGNWFVNQFDNLNNALKDIPLWIANYSNIQAPPDCGGWTRWLVWQYTEKGTVSGIEGHIDMNAATSLAALKGTLM
ncbi:hypothetical protein GK047_12825 [Paenibacillus sp. SYP-B3998]|uniref:Lysozyme n=1 Tax=Paenibacillus sp. SYP-B3998 TaxID=2678564 RepID=A0A6G3ZXD9_9BACL|nr:glycoside hydrolase family 25 protein [Paenibacillus sp. SYP-B3998]NEW06886.1 hypothetical protein [Paenibacillus sp. SYP-B3998]